METKYINIPLYTLLAEKVNNIEKKDIIQNLNLDKLRDDINSMKTEQLEQIVVLFIHWYYISTSSLKIFSIENFESKSKKNILPYGIKIHPGRNGFSMELCTLPIAFQLLLMEYCNYKY